MAPLSSAQACARSISCQHPPASTTALSFFLHVPFVLDKLKPQTPRTSTSRPTTTTASPSRAHAMKKFGFGKKGDEGDDTSRNALFGRKKASPAPQSDNPYAQQGANDPYADSAKYANVTPYQQARTGLGGSQRPAGGQPPASLGPGPGPGPGPAGGRLGGAYGPGSPAPPSNGNGFGASQPTGYSADRYGSGGGYGSNRYENKPGSDRYNSPAAGARGPGGYGGFGRANDNAPDENRDALFSGAQERLAQKQPSPAALAPGGSYDQSGAAGGSYEKRQVQQESASSVSRSLQMARQANEVGQATLARLGAQGERLHNTEKNLDLAANQNKIAQDRAAELKTLNRSMFAVHVGNPFTSKQRQQKADGDVLNRHRTEREQREQTRHEGYAANQRMETTFRDINSAGRPRPQARKKDYGKFNLDDEEGADELEDQIDDGLNELEGQVSMMNMVGRAIGKEVETQNKQIDRIMTKSDAVDDATRMNRERLARIK
ncbi:Protein transport protein SEC9 [Tolypocladium ophioglossoides CBS 100239]|uniref:Protein transport protein SEC9 n=1 Tax=Tolypocladium ophioglossoides (strain CBS 100239) TaxID=1163406 RepID=A0A0L0N847_TOLOC|nr:Protein transport protein SEC9 [Tolypocladium ophioglossoides CBS 100239]